MESGREQNYWPGFVDALSNVVLTLVFVLVVFVFALVIASNKVERRAANLIKEAQESTPHAETLTKVSSLEKELEKARQEIKELHEQATASKVEEKVEIPVGDNGNLVAKGKVTISKTQGKVVIVYPKAITDLDDRSTEELDRIIGPLFAKGDAPKVKLLSFIGQESFSAARRLAYYRILSLRKHLIARYKVQSAQIESQIVQPKEDQDGRVEILLQ